MFFFFSFTNQMSTSKYVNTGEMNEFHDRGSDVLACIEVLTLFRWRT